MDIIFKRKRSFLPHLNALTARNITSAVNTGIRQIITSNTENGAKFVTAAKMRRRNEPTVEFTASATVYEPLAIRDKASDNRARGVAI